MKLCQPRQAGYEPDAAITKGGYLVQRSGARESSNFGDVCGQVSLRGAGVVNEKFRDFGIEKGHALPLVAADGFEGKRKGTALAGLSLMCVY